MQFCLFFYHHLLNYNKKQLTLNLIEEAHKAYINDFKIESVVRYDNEETKYPKEYKTFEDETMNTFLYVSQK